MIHSNVPGFDRLLNNRITATIRIPGLNSPKGKEKTSGLREVEHCKHAGCQDGQ